MRVMEARWAPTSPTTPEPECDTFAIAPSDGGLTQRALDGGESAAFSSILLASSFFYSRTESASRPPASNANRWAAIGEIHNQRRRLS
jgi:hypothetical protein